MKWNKGGKFELSSMDSGCMIIKENRRILAPLSQVAVNLWCFNH